MDNSLSYRRDTADVLLSCALEDLTLLYHRRSGQTHMVISPVPELLDRMADGAPVTAHILHDRLAQEFDLGPPDEAIAEITTHLDALAALGLVRPA